MNMSRGIAFAGLPDAKAGKEAKITVISGEKSRGEKSRVITPYEAAELAEYLGAEHLVMKGENHSILNSLGRVAALFDLLHAEERLLIASRA